MSIFTSGSRCLQASSRGSPGRARDEKTPGTPDERGEQPLDHGRRGRRHSDAERRRYCFVTGPEGTALELKVFGRAIAIGISKNSF